MFYLNTAACQKNYPNSYIYSKNIFNKEVNTTNKSCSRGMKNTFKYYKYIYET